MNIQREITFKENIKNILFLVDSPKSTLLKFTILFLILSFLELISLGIIGPYIAVIVDPNYFFSSKYFEILVNFNFSLDGSNIVPFLGYLLLLVFIVKTILTLLINKAIFDFSFDQEFLIREKISFAIQHSSFEKFQKINSEDFIHSSQRLANDFSQILIALLKMTGDIFIAIAIFTMLLISEPYALLFLSLLFLLVLTSYHKLFKRRIVNYGFEANQSLTKIVKTIVENINGYKEIKLFGKQKFFTEKFLLEARKYSNAGRRYALVSMIPRQLMELIIIFAFVFIVLFNSNFPSYSHGELLSILGVFGFASLRLLPSATQLMSGFITIKNGQHSIFLLLEKIETDFKTNDSGISDDDKFQIKDFESMKLLKVGYKFPGASKEVLRNVNLDISIGDSIGIYGESGAGKSTLINLISGLIDNFTGKIIVNQMESKKTCWTNLIAYLPQNVFLINDSIMSNIALGVDKKDINISKLMKAIKMAKLDKFVKNLENGILSNIGENGIRISGGQRQRIAIARAFYLNRNILILDEATSALDTKTEQGIMNEIGLLGRDITTIIISHNIKVLDHCDKIFELTNGELIKK